MHVVHEEVHEREPAAALGDRVGRDRRGLAEVSAVSHREDEHVLLDARNEVHVAVVTGRAVLQGVRHRLVGRDSDLVARRRVELRRRQNALDEAATLGEATRARLDCEHVGLQGRHVSRARDAATWPKPMQKLATSGISGPPVDTRATRTYHRSYTPFANTEIGDGCPAPLAVAPGPRPSERSAD